MVEDTDEVDRSWAKCLVENVRRTLKHHKSLLAYRPLSLCPINSHEVRVPTLDGLV